MKRYIILLLFCTSLSLGASIDEIVRQFPAENLQTRDELCLALLTLGESAIIDICSRLGPAGSDDSAQRFAIAGLCDVASRSDDNAKIVQNALLQAIESKTEPQVQSFLLEQLALIGDATAIRSLEPLLQNDELVDATVRAMITIDPRTAEDYLVRNLDKSDHHQLIAILNALGEIGSAKAVPDLIALAESEHRDVRDGALYALSKSGSAEAGEILGRAMAAAAAMERDKACSYYCDYVEGCAAKKADLYLQLLNAAPPAHVACRAMRGLFEIEGKDCFAVLLEQSEKDAERCGCALRLSAVLAEENISRQWIQFARQTPAREAMIVRALAIRRDESAMAFVAEAMTSLNDDVRLAAVSSYARQQGAAAYDELLRVLQAGRAQEMAEATAQLLSYASSGELLLRLRADLPTLPSISQASVLQMFASRGDVEAKETLYSKANEADSVVRFAALQSLTALVDSTDVTRLLDLLSAAGDEFEFQSLQEALVAAANSARAIDAKPILAAFGEQSGEKKVHLLHVLAQLNSKEALVQVIKTAASTKDDLRASALQALASGPRAKTIPLFLDIAAETGDEQMKELAMEKAQRLARDTGQVAPAERLQYCREMLEMVNTAEEKTRILTLAAIDKRFESLQFIEPHLEFADVQREAAALAVDIAAPDSEDDSGLAGNAVIDILYKVLAIPADSATHARAKNYLHRLDSGRGRDPETGAELNEPPAGYMALFNGRDLTGWKGLAGKDGNPYERGKLSPQELLREQARADSIMRAHWRIEDGVLIFDGQGSHLCTQKEYRNFELLVDWKIAPGGDSGIYLRGSPQVQIWDPQQWPEGSGGLYNNQMDSSKPLVRADHPAGEWNTFRIRMIGERVTVHLNGILVVDDVVLENYWDRNQPIYPLGQIELQSHGSILHFRNIFMREIFSEQDGWSSLFDGESLAGWTGAVDGYTVQDGAITSKPGSGGNLFTEGEYSDFEFTFEFKLAPGANSGLGIRAPLRGDAAYVGMELQILDDSALQYAQLHPYQYHGSVYGVVAAKRGHQRKVGEWNSQQVTVKGSHVRVELNGVTIVDADVAAAARPRTPDGRDHPGLRRKKGHIGFLGHHAYVQLRNIHIKEL